MNADRRKRIAEATELVTRAREVLDSVKDEEQEAFDNLPESFQSGAQGEKMSENIDLLDTAVSDLETIEESLNDLTQ